MMSIPYKQSYSIDNELAWSPTDMKPSNRIRYIKQWYKKASPYRFIWFDRFNKRFTFREYYLGIDVEIFANWELATQRITDQRFQAEEMNYWEYVNAHFLQDLQMAEDLYRNNQNSCVDRIQYLVEYLRTGTEWRKHNGYHTIFKNFNEEWLLNYQRHFMQMCHLFWKSHNTSIVYWDLQARLNGFYANEDPIEQIFIDGVIIRMDFTSDLPVSLPIYGNMVIPIGIIGEFLNQGPFKYPRQYPAPKPEIFDYGAGPTAKILERYFTFLMKFGFNAVYTWWIPTPANPQLEKLLQEKKMKLNTPLEEWIQKLIQPAQRTIQDIHCKYLFNLK